jgi:nitrogen-specific signal transduction histidine kinase
MNIAVVGGGTRCLYLLDFMKKTRFKMIESKIVAVADIDQNAPGFVRAREMGLFVTNDYTQFFGRNDIDLIIELTGNLSIYHDILLKKKEHVRALAHTTALLFWKMDDAHKKVNDSELRLIQKQNIYEVLMNQFIQEEAMVIDQDYRVVDMNEAMMKKLGRTSQEVIGKFCYQVGHHLDKPCTGKNHPCPLTEVYKTKKPCMTNHVHLDQNNNEIYYAISCYPLNNNDEIVGVIEILRDITPEIRVQKAQMQQEKLMSIGRLSAGVAHEINNPLTTIMTSSMMLQEELDADNEMYEELQIIANEAQRCRKIVQSLLDFARQTKPMQKLQDINSIITESIYLTKKQAEFSEVVIRSDLADQLPKIYVDKEQIQQLLINLILNAVESTGPGGSITISTFNFQESGEIGINVADTGKGIAKENLEKIFDPFFTTREYGTGLGLSIVHSIVERHSGTIEVDSQPEQGTCFKVRLPVGGVGSK